MKLNIADPKTGCQKSILIEDEMRVRFFYDHRLGAEIAADPLGPDYKGYVFKVTGGCDQEGFPMMQGILDKKRVRLLLNKDSGCYHPRRSSGERRRKSVRGCIISPAVSVLNLIIVKQGEQDIDGLTNDYKPRRLGPKRANNIRKLFNLSKEDDVRKYVIRRRFVRASGKKDSCAPHIQRLVTPERLNRKRHRLAVKKYQITQGRKAAAEYEKMIAQRHKATRDAIASKRRSASIRKASTNVAPAAASSSSAAPAKATTTKTTPKTAPKAAPKTAPKTTQKTNAASTKKA